MNEGFSVAVTLFSYVAGAWIAFKIFDYRKKGKKAETKDDLLLWPLLIVFALGGGALMTYMLKSLIGLE
jgi:hypothetical protein